MAAAGPASAGVARAIAASLLGGVTTFALVAWFIARQAPLSADDPATATLFLYAWLALAAGAAVAALVVWRTRVAHRIRDGRDTTADSTAEARAARPADTPADPRDDGASEAEAVQNALVITWALIEAPALFGIVIYLLYGSTPALAGGLLLAWVGIGLTWPRAHWFR